MTARKKIPRRPDAVATVSFFGREAGKRMADDLKCEVVLCYVIVVPRDLPIQSPMQKEEDRALEALQEAQKYMTARGVPHRILLERGRDTAVALENVTREQNAAILLIPLSPDPDDANDDLKLIKGALTKLSGQVAFIRGPMLQKA